MKSAFFPAFLLAPGLLLPGVSPADEAEAFTLSSEAVENLELETAPVEPRSIQPWIRAVGSVSLDEKRVVDVAPRIAGMIEEDYLRLGDPVEQGQPLFRIQSIELAELLSAYIDAEQAMQFASIALQQERNLVEKELSSSELLREKELAFQQSVAAHARALQPLKMLHFTEASIHPYLDAISDLDYTSFEVRAPAAGEIIAKSIRLGAAVDPEESLLTIADLSEVWVDFTVALRDAAALQPGMEVEIQSSVSEETGTARVSYVAPLAEEASRSVHVRAIMENAGRAWRPGSPVIVRARVGPAEVAGAALAVPVSALVDLEDRKAVFLRKGDGSFQPVFVETGESDGQSVQILSGLEAGQTVVSRNAAQLKGHLEMTATE